MALGLTQPVTEMCYQESSWEVKVGRRLRIKNVTAISNPII
jgi:hypothetical protein